MSDKVKVYVAKSELPEYISKTVTPESIGAAPSGFGLGEMNAPVITSEEELNNTKKSGWYKVYFKAENGGNISVKIGGVSIYHGILEVQSAESNRCIQKLTMGYFTHTVVRSYSFYNGSWDEWKWETPAMQNGVEYLTTMFDNGKALYLQRGDNGAIFYRRDGEDTWYAMASRIDGTFANVVAANPTAQDPATRQLRNSTIASTETTPSYNGEICWVYE